MCYTPYTTVFWYLFLKIHKQIFYSGMQKSLEIFLLLALQKKVLVLFYFIFVAMIRTLRDKVYIVFSWPSSKMWREDINLSLV